MRFSHRTAAILALFFLPTNSNLNSNSTATCAAKLVSPTPPSPPAPHARERNPPQNIPGVSALQGADIDDSIGVFVHSNFVQQGRGRRGGMPLGRRGGVERSTNTTDIGTGKQGQMM
mmetsp:Transcript_11290/g.23703  ORF Transcript_11290/g.23703 Transcript_11290/m.23703 type:complete len:117 (+) Transcript_11290:193-543(+)